MWRYEIRQSEVGELLIFRNNALQYARPSTMSEALDIVNVYRMDDDARRDSWRKEQW